MDIISAIIGVVGVAVGCWGIVDARRQRNIGDRLSQHQSETIHNLYGFLMGLKTSPLINLDQINYRLEFIKRREAEFRKIGSGTT